MAMVPTTTDARIFSGREALVFAAPLELAAPALTLRSVFQSSFPLSETSQRGMYTLSVSCFQWRIDRTKVKEKTYEVAIEL